MDKFVIQGGQTLRGSIDAGGSKNCALPILFATLLSADKSVISGVPKLRDMESTLMMLVHLGCEVDQHFTGAWGADWTIDARKLKAVEAPYDLVRKMRASTWMLGPVLAREGRARASLPGGCAIGARPIDLHLMAFEKLGAEVNQNAGYIELKIKNGRTRLTGAHIVFPIVSVGATANALMAATLAEGITIIDNAAQEPEMRDLCLALQSMGAKIKGTGTSRLEIEGVSALSGLKFKVPADRIETATYLIGAHMTGGDVLVRGANVNDLGIVLDYLRNSGASIEITDQGVRCFSKGDIQPVDVSTAPFPGFPTDDQAQWVALMTQANGDSLITETIFENRFMHVPELCRMGAKISVIGSSVRIKGAKNSLEGAPIMASDLRASAALVLAGLVARGQTVINRIYHLDRGYEAMESKLRTLGAHVEREGDA